MNSAIVTGASSGIGKEIALAIAPNYEYIAIAGFTHKKELSDLRDRILKSNPDCCCHAFVGDISDYNFVNSMIKTVISEAGGISVLINNAGISYVEPFTDTSPEKWKRLMGTNLDSMYNTCHCALPSMLSRKEGRIINISSVWGLTGASCEVAYSAAKGAIISFTKALAKELAPSNISVNAVAFGAIDTDMNSHLNSDEKENLCEDIPFGRMATTKEAATFVKQLLDMPMYHTGDILKFDGSWI